MFKKTLNIKEDVKRLYKMPYRNAEMCVAVPLTGMQEGMGGCHFPWRHLDTRILLAMW